MNREFLELYDRELKLLYERGQEFAKDYPEMAGRLGSLSRDNIDPMIGGLLEGTAFLAARVQQKLKSEFGQFTAEMIDRLLPGFLSGTPSFALVRVEPDYSNPALASGIQIPRGSTIDTNFIENDERINCRYRLASPITLWPYAVGGAAYYGSAAPLHAQGIEPLLETAAGLKIELVRQGPKSEAGQTKTPALPVSGSTPDELRFYLSGPQGSAALIYELLFARLNRLSIRYLNETGDPRMIRLPQRAIQPVGFDGEDSLFGHDDRMFAGFNHIREYFAFPVKYLGFSLHGLASSLSQIGGDRFELVFEFDQPEPAVASAVKADMFSLFAAPAANLFEMDCMPVQIRDDHDENAIVVDRSKKLNYEIYRIETVRAQNPGAKERETVYPLYSAPFDNSRTAAALFYSARRQLRQRTDRERRTGVQAGYMGGDTFISLREPPSSAHREPVRALFIRATVSNRHLPERLTMNRNQTHFTLSTDSSIRFQCISGPTAPRESLLFGEANTRGSNGHGPLLWKLISLLQFNHLSLSARRTGDSAAPLRECLSIFADISNPSIERRIRGITSVTVQPINRKLRQANGFNVARGQEVTVEMDENAFEGHGVFLFAAVLRHFFSEYAAINSFTETVLRSHQRNILNRWPPLTGGRGVF